MGKGRGFTLVELLVVISIVGLLCFSLLPVLNRFRGRVCLKRAASLTVANLRLAQAKAILHSNQINCLVAGEVLPGVAVMTTKTYAFTADGFTPPAGSGTSTLTSKHGKRKVIVSSMGRVRSE
ncbi:MAG: type II secretion system protein [Candidatus Margulisiibacteriota bacterium]|jgi:prepilin-type N-terminal cleavage/methylation domain-containing protein